MAQETPKTKQGLDILRNNVLREIISDYPYLANRIQFGESATESDMPFSQSQSVLKMNEDNGKIIFTAKSVFGYKNNSFFAGKEYAKIINDNQSLSSYVYGLTIGIVPRNLARPPLAQHTAQLRALLAHWSDAVLITFG